MIIEIPNMVLIGSSGQSSGKTTLACKIIKQFADIIPIYVVKIISIDDANGRCHRGQQGCGICTTLQGSYDIQEEHNTNNEKDTSKMLQSGAQKSFLIRSLKPYLQKSFKNLQEKIPSNVLIVCESNSLRHVVKPGVFLFVNNTSDIMKASAKSVLPFADEIVTHESQNDIINRLKYMPADKYNKNGMKNQKSSIKLEGAL